MSDDDYLWDPRSRGPRDPLVERLERTLQARQLEPPRRGIRPLVVLPLAAAAVVLGLVGWQAYADGDAAHPPAAPQAFHAREFHAREGEVVEPASTAQPSLASGDAQSAENTEAVDAHATLADAGPEAEIGAAAPDEEEEEVVDPEVEVAPEAQGEEGSALTGR